jgi:hypothetical protein
MNMQIERDDDVAGWGRCIPRKTWAEHCREVYAGTRYVRKKRQGAHSGMAEGPADLSTNGDAKKHEP